PVFQRITQQVLEYLHVPHDMQLPPNRQLWLAQNKVPDSDLDESSPDHLGSALELADAASDSAPIAAPSPVKPPAAQGAVVPVSLREKEPSPSPPVSTPPPPPDSPQPTISPSNGTVVLDVEQGGIEVPSFVGKSLRNALEIAQASGLE